MKSLKPQFPIGKLSIPQPIKPDHITEAIEVLRLFPERLSLLAGNFTENQLNTPYREGSWTIRQLIHHIADSHNHCYNRIRWTLTEDSPVIKAYHQDGYAAMDDYKKAPIDWSLSHIEILHHKIVYIFSSVKEKEWDNYFIHPETNAKVTVKEMVLTYAWHSNHHFAHIENALK